MIDTSSYVPLHTVCLHIFLASDFCWVLISDLRIAGQVHRRVKLCWVVALLLQMTISMVRIGGHALMIVDFWGLVRVAGL